MSLTYLSVVNVLPKPSTAQKLETKPKDPKHEIDDIKILARPPKHADIQPKSSYFPKCTYCNKPIVYNQKKAKRRQGCCSSDCLSWYKTMSNYKPPIYSEPQEPHETFLTEDANEDTIDTSV